MAKKLLGLLLVTLIMATSGTAKAEEKLMVLWPKQRASHQATMDEQAAQYKARGQAYVDHLYDTNGEEPMPEDVSFEDDIKPVPVNVGQVADIVKSAEAKGMIPSPSVQTGATPQ